MPSGTKKRKAAKKKKQKEANNNNSAAHSHGDDDQNVHDEKESDGGDDSSPVSQDHRNHQHSFTEEEEEDMEKREDTDSSPVSQDHRNHQHSFTEGEEEDMEKREDTSTVQSIVSECEPVVGITGNGESTPKMAMEEKSVVQVDWELKPEDDSDSKDVNIEHVESVKESHGGRISLNVGSSSSSSSSSNSSSDDESHVVEKNVVVVESGESNADAPNLVTGSVAIADSVYPVDFPEVTDGVPAMEAYNLVVGEPKEEAYDPVAANAPSVNLVKPTDLPDVPIIEAYSLVVGTVPLVDYMGPQPEEDKVASTAGENSAVSSGAMGIAAQEDEDKLLPSSGVPTVETSNGAEHVKDSMISECSDSQPLVASARRPVQTTSWMSCCGLFEVFTGSNT